jgi:chitin disaccharide deacetylase
MFKTFLLAPLVAVFCFAQSAPTYAERLGWSKGDRVLILHMDDAGMSHDSNIGIERVLEKGAARSLSVMMPTTSRPILEPMPASISHLLRSGTSTVGGH